MVMENPHFQSAASGLGVRCRQATRSTVNHTEKGE